MNGGGNLERKAHFFFAVRLPIETKLELKDACLAIKDDLPFQRWVHHEDYHITLAFLGAAHEEKLAVAKKLVEASLSTQKEFSLHIDQLGVFGKEDAPRILWANTKKEIRLSVVRDIVFSACLQAGFKLETRPFTPHITLARKWLGNKPFHSSLLHENNPFENSSLIFKASEVILYQTHVERIPKYDIIEHFPFLAE